MKITNLKINHISNPLGYWYRTLSASWKVEEAKGQKQKYARILVALDESFETLVWDSGKKTDLDSRGTSVDVSLKPRTRYYWKVQVWDDAGDAGESCIQWFETGLMETGFQGIPITPDLDPSIQPVYEKTFTLAKKPEKARLYLTCLGVYELEINGKRVGEEFLAPGFTVYEDYVQYQTYDVGAYLTAGENVIRVLAGDGWYKGLYGYRQNEKYREGKVFELLADLYTDDECILCTDLSWKVRKSQIVFSDHYDGEIYDACLDDSEVFPVKEGKLKKNTVKERLGVPVKAIETVIPKAVLHTPAGETVLDMGQNMAGYVSFFCREPKGTHVVLEHGEVLQDGNFFRKNYRTAKARYEYISDGVPRVVHARLCFFGFQYIRITGISEVKKEDFTGVVLCSALENTMKFETGHALLNRLMKNVVWSQKGNFIDIPTDCPQRDEKMGWTGDAQIFSETACMNMECYPFFRKYLHDIAMEQKHTGGLVPQVVPSVGRNERTSAAWGDAAVIIPWRLYTIYGDARILKEQYDSMKAWIAYIDGENEKYGTNPNLWQNGFHYGDWLALDGGCYHMPTGGTDVFYVSSAYFYYSVKILAKTAEILGKPEEEQSAWREKAERIRQAIYREYFTGNGKLAIDTQTAGIVALCFGIVGGKEAELVKEQFLKRMQKDGYRLKTGFVGTPFLLEALSLCGREDLAYQILLDEGFPSWLYPVTMGATTMWERWDALNPDGSMSDNGMNSLNHYANGSVAVWIYEHIGGICQLPGTTGFAHVEIAPKIHPGIGKAGLQYESASGTWKVSWHTEVVENGEELVLEITVPFDAEAEICLPFVRGTVLENGKPLMETEDVLVRKAGTYQYRYLLDSAWRPHYSMGDSVRQLIQNPELKAWLYEKVPMLQKVDGAEIQNMTLEEMSRLPFFLGIGTRLGLDAKTREEIKEHISKIEVSFS